MWFRWRTGGQQVSLAQYRGRVVLANFWAASFLKLFLISGASATSSYDLGRDGTLTPISTSAPTGQTSACWAALTPDGRFAFVTNTGSGSITGYAVDFEGQIELLDDDGRTGVTGDGSAPIDVVISDNGKYLYSLNSGTHTIGSFRIQGDGSLTPLPFAAGLPVGTNGLASR